MIKNVTNLFAQRNESISHYTTRKTTVSSAVHDKPLKPSLQQNPTTSNAHTPNKTLFLIWIANLPRHQIRYLHTSQPGFF